MLQLDLKQLQHLSCAVSGISIACIMWEGELVPFKRPRKSDDVVRCHLGTVVGNCHNLTRLQHDVRGAVGALSGDPAPGH